VVVAVAYKVPAPASAASAEERAAPIGERGGSFKRGKETATQAGSLPRGQEASDRGEWSTRWSRVMPAVAHGALLTLSETLTLTLHHHRSNWFDFPDMRVTVFAVADGHAGKFTPPPAEVRLPFLHDESNDAAPQFVRSSSDGVARSRRGSSFADPAGGHVSAAAPEPPSTEPPTLPLLSASRHLAGSLGPSESLEPLIWGLTDEVHPRTAPALRGSRDPSFAPLLFARARTPTAEWWGCRASAAVGAEEVAAAAAGGARSGGAASIER
jgi:hypothetical protein